MSKIDWPLNEPIETDLTEINGTTATVLFIDGTGDPCGYVEYDGMKWQTSWEADGKYVSGDCEGAPNLIPPKPARQYGYAVWGSDSFAWFKEPLEAANYIHDFGGDSVRFPVPRPGETLCVRPSREDVLEVVRVHSTVAIKTDAIMALLDGEA